MKDLTLHILENSYGLLAGVGIYYLIAVYKVFILWHIQPRYYKGCYGANNILSSALLLFIQKSSGNGKLWLYGFKYIFNPRSDSFLVVENEKNKRVIRLLNLLSGFTFFLNAYLLFGILWALIRFWIGTHWLYNDTQITLGEIQKFLSELSRYPFFIFLVKYKNMVFLFYALSCVLIPFLYARMKQCKQIEKYATVFITALLCLTQISFFGEDIGTVLVDTQKELKEIEVKITTVHNQIYQTSLQKLCPDELYEVYEYEEKANFIQADKLLRKIDQENRDDPSTRWRFGPYVVHKLYSSPFENRSFHSTEDKLKIYAGWLEENLKPRPGSPPKGSFARYMTDLSFWNLKKGQQYLFSLTPGQQENRAVGIKYKEKFIKIVDCLLQYSIECGTEKLFDSFEIQRFVTLKEVVSLLGKEDFKTSLLDQIARVWTRAESSTDLTGAGSFLPLTDPTGAVDSPSLSPPLLSEKRFVDKEACRKKIDHFLLVKEETVLKMIEQRKNNSIFLKARGRLLTRADRGGLNLPGYARNYPELPEMNHFIFNKGRAAVWGPSNYSKFAIKKTSSSIESDILKICRK